MTEKERQAIRASFAGKRLSQMTEIERKVFDEDFQYGISTQPSRRQPYDNSGWRKNAAISFLELLNKIRIFRK
jgi:hypothetical protein